MAFQLETNFRPKSQKRGTLKEEPRREFGKDITQYFFSTNDVSYNRHKIATEVINF